MTMPDTNRATLGDNDSWAGMPGSEPNAIEKLIAISRAEGYAAGQAAERERCAKLCDAEARFCLGRRDNAAGDDAFMSWDGAQDTAFDLARRIRSSPLEETKRT